MTPWEHARRWIFEAEGGRADHRHDRGGPTRYGISQAAHPEVDLDTLTEDEAADIYRKEYWLAARCEVMPAALALAVFDGNVQHGIGASVRMLQRVLDVTADGMVGPVTLGAIQARKWVGPVLRDYLTERLKLYHGIARDDATQRVFVTGWFKRVLRLFEYTHGTMGVR